MAKHIEAVPSENITIKLGRIGARVEELLLPVGSTVRDALRAVGLDEDGEVRCNGDIYSNGDPLDEGDVLVFIGNAKVEGR